MDQRSKRPISVLITMFALLSAIALPATAKADAVCILWEAGEQPIEVQLTPPEGDTNEVVDPLDSSALKEGKDSPAPPAVTPALTPAPTPSQKGVCLGIGEMDLYDEHGEKLGKLAIKNNNDYIAEFIPDASQTLTGGMVSIRFRPTETVLIDRTIHGETNKDMTPVWVEYSESSKQAFSFRAWLDQQAILNFNELVVAFQSAQQFQEQEPDGNKPSTAGKIDTSRQPLPTVTPTAPLSSADIIDEEDEQQMRLWELLQIVLLGISVLLGAACLIIGQLRERKNAESINRLYSNYNSLANATKDLSRNTGLNQALADMKMQLEAVNAILARLVQKGTASVAGGGFADSAHDPVTEFLTVVNAQTGVSARQAWYNSLAQHYKVEFAQYDAINGRFFVAKDEPNPLFAICSVVNEVFLIPSCCDTALQAVDLPMMYDIVAAARPASTYRIDKAAKLQPYGAYYTVATKGHITLLS